MKARGTHRRAAMTIMEVMASISILGVLALGIGQWFMLLAHLQQQARSQRFSAQTADNLAEQCCALSWNDVTQEKCEQLAQAADEHLECSARVEELPTESGLRSRRITLHVASKKESTRPIERVMWRHAPEETP